MEKSASARRVARSIGDLSRLSRERKKADGAMFVDHTDENAKDMEREARWDWVGRATQRAHPLVLCRNCRENSAERGSYYCTVCLVMFAML